jgi:hypothetical protein
MIPASAQQSTSDPDPKMNRRGQGSSLVIVQTAPEDPEAGDVKIPSVIVGVTVMDGNEHDSASLLFMVLMMILQGFENCRFLGDSAFKAQRLYELCLKLLYELESPLHPRGGHVLPKVPLDSFERDSDGAITACRRGRKASTTVRETGNGARKFRAKFNGADCRRCPFYRRDECRVDIQTDGTAVLSYDSKAMGLAVRETKQHKFDFTNSYCRRSAVEGAFQKVKMYMCFDGRTTKYRGRGNTIFLATVACGVVNFRRGMTYRSRLDKNWWRRPDNKL